MDRRHAGRAVLPRRIRRRQDAATATGRWCCGPPRPATPRSSRHGWPTWLSGSQLANMNDVSLDSLAAARDVLVDHQHFRRRRPARQRRGLLAAAGITGCAVTGRRSLCGAGHRRPVLRRLLWTRQVDRQQVRRSRRDQTARPRRVRSLRRRADGPMGARGDATRRRAPRAHSTNGRGRLTTINRPTKVAEPFTRTRPLLAPLSHECRCCPGRCRRKRCGSSALTSPRTTSPTRRATPWASMPPTVGTRSTTGWPRPDSPAVRSSRSTGRSAPCATR